MLNKEKIDLVIPFVDGNDPVWIKEFCKYKKFFNPTWSDGNIKTRYDGDDILMYVFRSVAKYAPWINKIHLLLSGPSQIPKWLNTENVHVVYHNEFMPEFVLPCFNSSTFENFIWNVPDLSEHFIYGNDDFIFNGVVAPKDFFAVVKGRILNKNTVRYGKCKISSLNSAWFSTFVNAAKLATVDTDVPPIYPGMYLTCEHDVKSCSKTQQKELYLKYENELKQSFSMFREEKNVNGYFYMIHEKVHDKDHVDSDRVYKYCPVKKDNLEAIEQILQDERIQSISLNDVNVTTIDDKLAIIELLSNKFPNKCKYER